MRNARFALVLAFAVAVLVPGVTWAGPIGDGLDGLHTREGAQIDLTPQGLGVVPLMGVPLSPDLGNTDTLVQRFGPGVDDGLTGPIQAELVQMQLMSVSPVPMGDSFFDVFVTESKQLRSPGVVQITSHNDPDGGMAETMFGLNVDVTLVDRATGQTSQFAAGPFDIKATDVPWTHMPPPAYPPALIPLANGFFVGPAQHNTPFFVLKHPTDPPRVPEPATLLLLGAGLSGLGALAWRGRRRSG